MHFSSSRGTVPERSRLLWMVGAGVCCFLVGIFTVREVYRRHRVDSEVKKLTSEVQSLEEKHVRLSELLAYLESSEAIDRDARLRLGMQKPGERVYVLDNDLWRDASPETSDAATTTSAVAFAEEQASNPVRWFHYFFRRSDAL